MRAFLLLILVDILLSGKNGFNVSKYHFKMESTKMSKKVENSLYIYMNASADPTVTNIQYLNECR